MLYTLFIVISDYNAHPNALQKNSNSTKILSGLNLNILLTLITDHDNTHAGQDR